MSDHKKKTRRVAVCIITDHEDNILMGLRNDSKKWAFPGGHLEPGEEPYIGMDRELEEETGLSVETIRLVKTKWIKEKNLMLYLFKVEPNPRQMPDPSNDPDKEFELVDYVDPNDVVEDLHVPLEDNVALKYWIEN